MRDCYDKHEDYKQATEYIKIFLSITEDEGNGDEEGTALIAYHGCQHDVLFDFAGTQSIISISAVRHLGLKL